MKPTDADSSRSTIADGGTTSEEKQNEPRPDTTGFGAVLGLLSGVALGSVFGLAGAIGVAALGAMLGDEYERREAGEPRVVVRELEL